MLPVYRIRDGAGELSKNEAILAPNLLSTRLRNEFGTITIPKFHLHMKNDIKGSKQMSLNCLDIIYDGLKKYKVYDSKEILKIPYGDIKIIFFDKIKIKMLNIWYFYLIGLIKKMHNLIYRKN